MAALLEYFMDFVDALKTHFSEATLTRKVIIIFYATVGLVILRSFRWRKKTSVRGKVVAITGASSGIGEALAHTLAQYDCKIILLARSVDKLGQMKQDLTHRYHRHADDVAVIHLDLEDHKTIPDVARMILNVHGRLDILINNAALGCLDRVVNTDLAVYKKIMNVNFFGPALLTKEIIPAMLKGCGGSILNVGSVLGLYALPGSSAYSASKHALRAFSDSLRAECGRTNVSVMMINPGTVTTSLFSSTIRGNGDPAKVHCPKVPGEMKPDSIARAIVQQLECGSPDWLVTSWFQKCPVYMRYLLPGLHRYVMGRVGESTELF